MDVLYIEGMHKASRRDDPWYARLVLHRPVWVTVWLVLILGSLVAIAATTGPPTPERDHCGWRCARRRDRYRPGDPVAWVSA